MIDDRSFQYYNDTISQIEWEEKYQISEEVHMKNLKRNLKSALMLQMILWLEYQPCDEIRAACLCFIDQLGREIAR